MAEYSLEETEAFRDRWLRCAAELENLRKRTAKQIEDETFRARQLLLLDFLEVVDSLERALKLGDRKDEEDSWYKGMKAIYEQMLDALRRQGARPFESMGRPFDPHRHDAVSCVSVSDREEGIIVEVTKTGYEMDDGQLLRAAQVVTTQRNGDER